MKKSLLLVMALFAVILSSATPASAQVGVRVGPVQIVVGGRGYYGYPGYVNYGSCYYDQWRRPICGGYDPYYSYYGYNYNYGPAYYGRNYDRRYYREERRFYDRGRYEHRRFR